MAARDQSEVRAHLALTAEPSHVADVREEQPISLTRREDHSVVKQRRLDRVLHHSDLPVQQVVGRKEPAQRTDRLARLVDRRDPELTGNQEYPQRFRQVPRVLFVGLVPRIGDDAEPIRIENKAGRAGRFNSAGLVEAPTRCFEHDCIVRTKVFS